MLPWTTVIIQQYLYAEYHDCPIRIKYSRKPCEHLTKMNWQLTFSYPTPQTDMDYEASRTYIFVCGKVCLWGRQCVRDRSGGALLISHIHSAVQSPMNNSGEIYWPSKIVKGFGSTLYEKPFQIYFNVSTFFNVRAGSAICNLTVQGY